MSKAKLGRGEEGNKTQVLREKVLNKMERNEFPRIREVEIATTKPILAIQFYEIKGFFSLALFVSIYFYHSAFESMFSRNNSSYFLT